MQIKVTCKYLQTNKVQNLQQQTLHRADIVSYNYPMVYVRWFTAKEVFHQRISQEFEALDGIETDLDDFLIWGKDDDEHDKILNAWRKQEKLD